MIHKGQYEETKAITHGALGLLALACFTYNALAWWKRRETHLLVGAGIYAPLVAWEFGKTKGHLDALREQRNDYADPRHGAAQPPLSRVS